MKNLFLFACRVILTPVVLVLVFAPYLALVFAASMVAAGIAGWGFGNSLATAYIQTGLWIYAGLGIFTLGLMCTFMYQNCCVGIESFSHHVRHHHHAFGYFDMLLSVLAWPWMWFCIDRNYRSWGIDFVGALCNAVEYWVVSRWRGVEVTMFNFK